MKTTLIRHPLIYRTETRRFSEGNVLIRNGRIAALAFGQSIPLSIEASADEPVEVIDATGLLLLPGLVDVHTHGRAGGDFGTADRALMTRMAESYLRSGVTTVLPTLASAPLTELYTAIERIEALSADAKVADGHLPHIAGVHIEGRYLNIKKRGAHAPELLAPLDPDELAGLLDRITGARHISAALELDESGAFLDRALSMGATVALGHSNADYATAADLIARGVTGMTHLFNAMPPLHHRDGGAVAAGLLSESAFCELICDGFHIAPEMVRLAARLAGERLVLITDSMEATGCPDGEYSIAGMPVTVKDGKARTHDGAIAGSTLSLWQAIENLCDFAGVPFGDALYAATMAPACEVGLASELGSIDLGKRADLLLCTGRAVGPDRPTVSRIMCGGVWVD